MELGAALKTQGDRPTVGSTRSEERTSTRQGASERTDGWWSSFTPSLFNISCHPSLTPRAVLVVSSAQSAFESSRRGGGAIPTPKTGSSFLGTATTDDVRSACTSVALSFFSTTSTYCLAYGWPPALTLLGKNQQSSFFHRQSEQATDSVWAARGWSGIMGRWEISREAVGVV